MTEQLSKKNDDFCIKEKYYSLNITHANVSRLFLLNSLNSLNSFSNRDPEARFISMLFFTVLKI